MLWLWSLNLRYHTQLKILTPKQIFQRLPIALAKVKAGNTSENLLNQTRQFIYSLYRAKEITKWVSNNIMNLINVSYKMDTIFMNSRKSKTSDPNGLLLNLTDKINLKRNDKYASLSNLSVCYKWKNLYKNNEFKISALTWNEKFELPDE